MARAAAETARVEAPVAAAAQSAKMKAAVPVREESVVVAVTVYAVAFLVPAGKQMSLEAMAVAASVV